MRTAYPWITRVHVYEHATVRLHFFRVTSTGAGEPQAAREAGASPGSGIDAPIAEPMLPANAPVLASLALPLEYAITDAQALGAAEQLARVEARMKDGLRLVQVRDKGHWERARLIYVVTSMARQYGAKVLVNGGPAGRRHPFQRRAADDAARAAAGRAELHADGRVLPHGAGAGPRDGDRAGFRRARPGQGDARRIPARPCSAGTASGASPRARRSPSTRSAACAAADLDAARRAGAHGLAMISGSWN